MDPAQLDRWNNNWKVTLAFVITLFFINWITVLFLILTMLSFPKPTKDGDHRFTLAGWTMTAAFVRAVRSKLKLSLSDEIMRADLHHCHLCPRKISLVTTRIRYYPVSHYLLNF